MKLTDGLTRHMNACTGQIIQQVFLPHMQPEQDMPMPEEDDNVSDNFGFYKDEKSTTEMQDIERDHRDLVGENSDTRSCARAGRTSQDRLFESRSPSSLREVRFSEQELPTGTPVSNIKYDHLESKDNNLFYLFHNQLDYTLAYYFAKSENTKGNVNKFLSNQLMVPLTKKLSYQNTDKWMEKLLKIS